MVCVMGECFVISYGTSALGEDVEFDRRMRMERDGKGRIKGGKRRKRGGTEKDSSNHEDNIAVIKTIHRPGGGYTK